MGFSSFFGVWDNLGSVMLWNLSENLTAAVKYLNYTTHFYFNIVLEWKLHSNPAAIHYNVVIELL